MVSDAYTYQKTDELEARGFEFKPIEIETDWEEEDLEERYPLLSNLEMIHLHS